MYERSAIVLERYFDDLLGYSDKCNLRDNFNNYCNLVEKLEKFQINYNKELSATQEFNKSLKKVRAIQSAQEKLYQRAVKLEYNRNLLFNNIEGKVEDTRKGIEKVEEDVEKNNQEMQAKKEELLEALVEYNEKRFELSKCKRYKKMAENDYNEIFEISQTNFEGITQDRVAEAKKFAKFDDSESIIEVLEDNGKGEKIPFNEGVMENATKFSIENSKKLVSSYLVIYDKMNKLLTDINAGVAKVGLHKKYARNEKAKVDFLLAVKEYVVQFLDYERMTVIHGRKSHNRLMTEACENFETDIKQIDNLFELLLREIANKATKKAYKELYNKSYLIDIQEKEERFKKEKNRVNLNTATLINSNYWRIDGIKNIYTIFYKTVSEVFERDVAEFDLPKEIDDESPEEIIEQNEIAPIEEEIISEKAKIPFEIDSSLDIEDDGLEEDDENKFKNYSDYSEIIDDVADEIETEKFEEEFDIFGEKYHDVDVAEVTRELLEKENEDEKKKENADTLIEDMDEDDFDDIENIEDRIFEDEESIFKDDNIPYEEEEGEENLEISMVKNRRKKENEIEDFDLTKEEKGKNIIKKLRKISNVKRKKTEEDIW